MAGEPRPWPTAQLDTPRRRYSRASGRDALLMVPLVVAVIAAGVVVGRWGAFAVLAVFFSARTALVASHGATPSMRRAGITFVRLGTGAVPDRWRLVVFQVAPLLYVAALFLLVDSAPTASLIVPVGYLALLAVGWWRARRAGHPGVDPLQALAGLDVWWAGDPPTPSGTSGPPAPAPPPPTPAAPTTPDPAPPPDWQERR